jgi:hypothetical protein
MQRKDYEAKITYLTLNKRQQTQINTKKYKNSNNKDLHILKGVNEETYKI